jgi:hypothetical protein
MSKKKARIIHDNNIVFDREKAKVGDVVEIRWRDVHAYERIEMNGIEELDEPESTVCWGAIVRKGDNYLFIASEIGDKDSDGVWVEALPYGMILSCKVISTNEIKSRCQLPD